MKKIGLSYPEEGWTLFSHSNHSASGCHQENACPCADSIHLFPSEDPLAFTAPISPSRELETRNPLEQLRSPDSCRQRGISERRDRGRFRQFPINKMSTKLKLLYAPPIRREKYPPWLSTLTIRCMHFNSLQHQKESILPSLLQKDSIQLHPTQ